MLSEGYRASMIAIVSPRNEKYVEANPKGCHKRKSVVTSSADDAKEKHRLLVQLTEELAQMVIADAKDDKAEDDTSKMPKLVADAKEGADDAKECAAAKKKQKWWTEAKEAAANASEGDAKEAADATMEEGQTWERSGRIRRVLDQ